ncbi:hypothetical protein V6N13_135221 [Hibiscus sabdariffa]|uniref:Uncharacterized protein n=1 Tax=Hibiscus sabdariffa TaxID=183260 RepID=A0ABR2R6C2_9ROSI
MLADDCLKEAGKGLRANESLAFENSTVMCLFPAVGAMPIMSDIFVWKQRDLQLRDLISRFLGILFPKLVIFMDPPLIKLVIFGMVSYSKNYFTSDPLICANICWIICKVQPQKLGEDAWLPKVYPYKDMLLIFSEIISPKWSNSIVLLYYYSISDEFQDIASNHGNMLACAYFGTAKRYWSYFKIGHFDFCDHIFGVLKVSILAKADDHIEYHPRKA